VAIISLIWGTEQLFAYRVLAMKSWSRNQDNEDEDIFEEDSWSFGQLVSVFMLLVPLLLVVEGCSGKTQI